MKNGYMKGQINFGHLSPNEFNNFNNAINSFNINTVCNSAVCPNRVECFSKNHLAFLILGDICTRNCKFCGIQKLLVPKKVDSKEPERIAKCVKFLNLKYCVITSVTRDDLQDGGAMQFVKTVNMVKKLNPNTQVEVLIPDFKGNLNSLDKILNSKIDILNHNIECTKSCFKKLRPMGDYKISLKILKYAKSKEKFQNKKFITKSGFMIGVGETFNDIFNTLRDLEKSKVDIITIGQYLPPDKNSFKPIKVYNEKEFLKIEEFAKKLRFKQIFCKFNVRSSYTSKPDNFIN